MNVNNYGNDASFNLLPSKVGETKYTLMQMLPAGASAACAATPPPPRPAAPTRASPPPGAEQAMKLRTAFAQYYLAARNERYHRRAAGPGDPHRADRAGALRRRPEPQQDAIRAQLEQTAMRGELIGIANEKRLLQARIKRPARARRRAPRWPSRRPLPPVPAAALAGPDLAARARASNPNVRAEAARLQAAQKTSELTVRNRYPDVTLGVSPSQMGSRLTTWGLMVELNIPLQQSTRRSQEREAAAMVEAARDRAEAAANQASADLEEQLSALEAARRNETLISTRQLPQSELVLQSAIAAYENGKVDFATLLEAQRQTRKARLDLLKTQVEAQMRVAEIERTLGEPL